MYELKEITCPYCGGYGYVLDVRATCCGNSDEFGNCCGIPDPEQYQKQCHCDRGTIIIEEQIKTPTTNL